MNFLLYFSTWQSWHREIILAFIGGPVSRWNLSWLIFADSVSFPGQMILSWANNGRFLFPVPKCWSLSFILPRIRKDSGWNTKFVASSNSFLLLIGVCFYVAFTQFCFLSQFTASKLTGLGLCFLSALVHYFYIPVLQYFPVMLSLLFCRSDTFSLYLSERLTQLRVHLNQRNHTSQFAWDSPGLWLLSVVTLSSTPSLSKLSQYG